MSLIHNVFDTDKHFSINTSTRELTNQTPEKTQLMQGDHNSERISFNMPRFVEGDDMTQCNVIQVHYLNIDSKTKEEKPGLYEIIDIQTSPEDENTAIFTWLVSAGATGLVGSLQFRITFKCVKDGIEVYRWNTEICKELKISKGISNSECFDEDCADFVSEWEERVEALEKKDGEIFTAIIGETTYAALVAAINAGKVCVLQSGSHRAYLTGGAQGIGYRFFRYTADSHSMHRYFVDPDSKWSSEIVRLTKTVDGKAADETGALTLNAVRYTDQTLTESQKEQARKNLGITMGGNGIPEGGSAGQILRKKSDTDFDVEWADFTVPEQYGLISYNQDKVITIT